MRTCILAALTIGIWVTAPEVIPPKERVIPANRTANAKMAAKTKQEQEAAHTEAIKAILAAQEQQNAQTLAAQTRQADQQIAIEGELVKYTRLLFYVAILQSAIFLLTGGAIWQQAKFFRNSERGWIMAQIRWSAEMLGVPDPTYMRVIEGYGRETFSVDICLIYKNDGRTPTWVMERRILFRQIEKLPIPPQFEVLPGDYRVVGPEPVTVTGDGKVQVTLTCPGRREKGKILAIYGFIKYRDVFKPERETRFGYVITPDNKIERMIGNRDWWQYSSYT